MENWKIKVCFNKYFSLMWYKCLQKYKKTPILLNNVQILLNNALRNYIFNVLLFNIRQVTVGREYQVFL